MRSDETWARRDAAVQTLGPRDVHGIGTGVPEKLGNKGDGGKMFLYVGACRR
jgi:hypothetical protein